MDLGVGTFIVIIGLVSKSVLPSSSMELYIVDIRMSRIAAVAPLFILGILRFVISKVLNYQEHVSEYGMHWNFFMTLGVILTLDSVAKWTPIFALCMLVGSAFGNISSSHYLYLSRLHVSDHTTTND